VIPKLDMLLNFLTKEGVLLNFLRKKDMLLNHLPNFSKTEHNVASGFLFAVFVTS
jgi:hypothetical protein